MQPNGSWSSDTWAQQTFTCHSDSGSRGGAGQCHKHPEAQPTEEWSQEILHHWWDFLHRKKSNRLAKKAGSDYVFVVCFFCLIVAGYCVYKCSRWAISYILILISNCSRKLTCFIYLIFFLLLFLYIFQKKKYRRKHKNNFERNALGKILFLQWIALGFQQRLFRRFLIKKDFQFIEGEGILNVENYLGGLLVSFSEYFGFLGLHLGCQHLHESYKTILDALEHLLQPASPQIILRLCFTPFGMIGRDNSGSSGLISLLKQAHPRAHGSRLCPNGSWIFSMRETPQPVWTTSSSSWSPVKKWFTVKKFFLAFWWDFLCINFCPLPLVQ